MSFWFVQTFLTNKINHEDGVKSIQRQVLEWRKSGMKTKMCSARPSWKSITLQNLTYKDTLYKVGMKIRYGTKGIRFTPNCFYRSSLWSFWIYHLGGNQFIEHHFLGHRETNRKGRANGKHRNIEWLFDKTWLDRSCGSWARWPNDWRLGHGWRHRNDVSQVRNISCYSSS